jgi:hypothetical protein
MSQVIMTRQVRGLVRTGSLLVVVKDPHVVVCGEAT